MKRILALLCAAATLTLSCKKSSSEPTPGPESKDFTIEQTDLTQGSFGVRITPKDNEGTYYFNVISKEDFAKLYSSDSDKLTAAYKAWFEQIATANGLALQDILKEALLSGMQNKPYNELVPNTEYVFFVYGLNLDGNATTAVSYYEFKTLEAKLDETATFNITPTEIGSTYFKVNFNCSDPSIRYYADVMLPHIYEQYCGSKPENIPSYLKSYLSALKSENDKFSKMSMAKFISTITVRGDYEYDTALSEAANELLPEMDYPVFAIGIANDGSFTTNVTVKMVRTSETPRNDWKLGTETITDIQYNTTIIPAYQETYAVILERKMYFEGASDEDMVNELLAARKGSFMKDLCVSQTNVEFKNLIPNEDYYLFLIACSTDGMPKTGDKFNVKKFDVKTKEAKPTKAVYTIKVYSVSKTSAKVSVDVDTAGEGQTFLTNYITKADLESRIATMDESEALKKHMDEFIDANLESWNAEHPNAKMDRKEFLSRVLPEESKTGSSSAAEITGLTAGTEYYAYVIGIKADGTYTTEPFKTLFKTIDEKKSKVTVSTLMNAWMLDENAPDWMLEKHPDTNKTNYNLSFDALPYASAGKLYTKAFIGTDEWAGKSSDELVTLLLKETPTLAQQDYYGYLKCQYLYSPSVTRGEMFYVYAIAYDTDDIPTDILKISHLSKEEGSLNTGMSKDVKIDKTETIAVAR